MSYIIAISGASGSGKTTIAEKLKAQLSDKYSVLLLSQDNYYNDQAHLTLHQREKTNYDTPEAFDQHLLHSHLALLANGQHIEAPKYCFETHTRLPETAKHGSSQVTIIEGLMLFNQAELRSKFDYGVFIDTPIDICLLRRINRDVKDRARTLDSITDQYLATVRPMFKHHIEPYKENADTLLSDFDQVDCLLHHLVNKVEQELG